MLDVDIHLFGAIPSREQNVGAAMFGFGQLDNEIISEEVVFPLFVRGLSEKPTSSFTYLGNYIAKKSSPVAWEELSSEVCFFPFHEQSPRPGSN